MNGSTLSNRRFVLLTLHNCLSLLQATVNIHQQSCAFLYGVLLFFVRFDGDLAEEVAVGFGRYLMIVSALVYEGNQRFRFQSG